MSSAVKTPSSNTSAPTVRRTRTSLDPDISPFVLDPSSVTLQRRLSASQYEAMYLYTPAIVTRTRTHADTLRICEYLDHLRHPHLEQFIGVVTDTTSREHMVLTAQRQGRSLVHYLSPKCADALKLEDVLQIAKQCSLALHYLHQTTETGHHGLCPHSIVYNQPRGKTVVLLTIECKKCFPTYVRPSRRADVATVAKIVLRLVKSLDGPLSGNTLTGSEAAVVAPLSLVLRQVGTSKNTKIRSMGDLCRVFTEAANQLV